MGSERDAEGAVQDKQGQNEMQEKGLDVVEDDHNEIQGGVHNDVKQEVQDEVKDQDKIHDKIEKFPNDDQTQGTVQDKTQDDVLGRVQAVVQGKIEDKAVPDEIVNADALDEIVEPLDLTCYGRPKTERAKRPKGTCEEPLQSPEAAQQAAEDTVRVGVDALPDEILMLIFSNVTDPTVMLDLSRVCRRWCRVARDPASWARVELKIKLKSMDNAEAYGYVNRARGLLHAPAAASLKVRTSNVRTAADIFPRLLQRQLSAVLRSQALVRTVDCECSSEIFWTYIAPFLYRQRHLRVLCLKLEDYPMLEGAAVPPYSGELAGKLPLLQDLCLHKGKGLAMSHLPEGLVGDLVRGARALRRLDVDMPWSAGDLDACAEVRGVQRVDLLLKGKPFHAGGKPTDLGRAALALAFCLAVKKTSRKVNLNLHPEVMVQCELKLPRWRKRMRKQMHCLISHAQSKNDAGPGTWSLVPWDISKSCPADEKLLKLRCPNKVARHQKRHSNKVACG